MLRWSGAILASGVALLATLHGGAAKAEDCKPLTLIASINLLPSENETAEFVPVKIAGTPKYMVLDTGSALTTIMRDAADGLNLRLRHGNFEVINVSGDYSSEFAEGSLELGNLKADNVAFAIMPNSNKFTDDKRFAGFLGADILSHYDVSVDFGTNKLDLLSPDHCEGKVIYWQAAAVAVVPIRVLKSGHILVPVTLDGQKIWATLDTGASSSTLSLDAAESDFGLKPGSADMAQRGDLLGRPGLQTYSHTFKSLEFNGIAVSDPKIDIIPNMTSDRMANTPQTGTRIADPATAEDISDMLLGMDVLKHLHLYIDYNEEKLYITPAGSSSSGTQTAGK
jgi:predicted aspartyl protease